MLLAPFTERATVACHTPARDGDHVLLAEDVSNALQTSSYSALRGIAVSVRGGTLFLEGSVSSFHLKQLAQEAAKRVLGHATIVNELDVPS